MKPPPTNQIVFDVGMRVRMSPLGKERCPGMAGKIGRVLRIGSTRYGSVTVLFDGNKRGAPLHRAYIEQVPLVGLKAKGK